MPVDLPAARAAVEQGRRAQREQRALWPAVRRTARALTAELEDNHLSERIRMAMEGRR